MADFNPHRFRDTFAHESLLEELLMDDLSKALGHSSVRVTEEYYGHWGVDRQKQLNDRMRATWKTDLQEVPARPSSRKKFVSVLTYRAGNQNSQARFCVVENRKA